MWPWRCGVQVLSPSVLGMDVNTDILREGVALCLLTGWHSPLFSTLPAKGTEGKPFSFMNGEQGNPRYLLPPRNGEHSDGMDSL